MTKRNIDLLSNKDMFIKYANVVEVARKAKIKIVHQGGDNSVSYNGLKENRHCFTIMSATPNAKGIEKFVGIIHELSHILFQSPFDATKKLLNDYWELKGERYQLFFNAFNVLEDQRIESQMGKMYLKHANRFDKTTKKLGKLMDQKILMMDNPINILLGIRFQRGDDMKTLKNFNVYKKALDDVILTDKFGALRVLVSIKSYIDEWMDEKESKVNMIMNQGMQRTDKDDEIIRKTDRDRTNTHQSFNENLKDSSGESPDVEPPDEVKDVNNLDSDEVDEMLDTNKENGKNVISDVFESLRDDGSVKKLPKNLEMVKRMDEKVETDHIVAKGMSKIFKTLMMRHSEFIDYDGDEVDVDAFVEGLIRGNDMGRCRINKKIVHGVSIVISIDGSTSMAGDRIYNARKMVATMFDSVKHLDNVDMRANVWSGNGYGKVAMTDIKNTSDIKNISIHVENARYYTTPIHMALEYSANMLKQMKGDKKMMIIITDGVPNHFNGGGYHIPMGSYMQSCKKSLMKAMNVTPNIMCIVVQDDFSFKRNPVRSLFKPSKLMNVGTMSKASERVIKRFKQMIMRSLV